jgi:hypothetical protein
MSLLVAANLGVRFLLELAALVGLVLWGVTAVGGVWGWLLGLVAAAAFAATWGAFVSPKARVRLGPVARLGLELALFGLAALALADAGQEGLAVALALVAVVSGTVNHATR